MLEPITTGLAKILKHIWYAIFEIPFEYWKNLIADFFDYFFSEEGPVFKFLLYADIIIGYFWRAIIKIPWEFWEEWVPKILNTASSWWKLVFAKAGISIGANILPFEGLEPEMKKMLDDLLKEGTWSSIFSAYAFFIPWYIQYSANTYGIISKDSLRAAMAQYTPSLPDMGVLINMLYRQPEKAEEVSKYMTWLGYDRKQQANVIKGVKPIYDIRQLATLLHRGEITQEEFTKGMSSLGYNAKEVKKLEKLTWYIPNVSDLVRMAVRESFTPEIVEKYGLGEDFPMEFAENARKQGLNEDWARHFWTSHWELPSIGMGFQMLHRGVIDEEDLNVLLRTQDVMPYWRERVTKISYTPYTRVDIRRLYLEGVIDEEEVFTAYKDIGYDDDKAEKMARFAILSVEPKEKDLTKSEVLDAMKKFIITPEECDKHLKSLGYSDHESAILRLRALHSKKNEVSELKISVIKKFYLSGVYSADKAMEKLGKLDLKAGYMSDLIELWELEKLKKVKLLSAGELKTMLQHNVIDPDEWSVKMDKLGYSQTSIDDLLRLYTGTWSEKKEKDLTKSEILSLLKRKLITEIACKAYLGDLGYDEIEVRLLIEKTLYEPEPTVKGLGIANIRKLYKLEIHTKEETEKKLKYQGLNTASRASLFSMWDSERKVPTVLLSKEDLKNLLVKDIIKDDVWRIEMGKLGYSDASIELLLTLYSGEVK